MKYNYGSWELLDGVTAHYATQAVEFDIANRELEVLASTRPIVERFHTLNYPTVTIRLSAPLEGVIKVEATHFQGAIPTGPAMEMMPLAASTGEIVEDGKGISLISGQLSARVKKGDAWELAFWGEGRRLTGSGFQNLAYMEIQGKRGHMREQLGLAPGEYVYGLGERFTPFIKNGQSFESWNRDGGAGSDHAYKCIPFYLTNRGYGVFVNHAEKIDFEIGTCNVSAMQFSVPGERLEYFVIYGPTPKQILERYTALTGRPALPPAWSFGLWLTTSFVTDYDENTVTSFLNGMRDRNLPLHVFHFDCFWMREHRWCDFTWDERYFPDPEAMLKRYKDRGLRICLWINPYIGQRSPLFAEGMKRGYLLKRPDGSVWQWDKWQAGMGIVDFTNSGAVEWFQNHLRRLVSMGVDSFKTDFGERIPLDVVWHDGSDPAKMHNFYSNLYNKVVFEVLEEAFGKNQALVYARSATAGGQRYPVHWSGDPMASFEAMAATLRAGLSLGLCGFGFWSVDMGGFGGTADPAVYKRWIAFGLLCSHSRLHGCDSYRVPWLFDEESVDVLRHFTNLKCRLMPYLYSQAIKSSRFGIPMMRAMLVDFPEDRACDCLDRQYMLGDDLLVAPLFSEDSAVDYYLPAGRWTHFLSGEVVEGGRWISEHHGMMSIPLLARPGSIIPFGANDQRPDYRYSEGVCLQLFEIHDGCRSTLELPMESGWETVRIELERMDDCIRIATSSALNDWSVLLRGVDSVEAVDGALMSPSPQGIQFRCSQKHIHIKLSNPAGYPAPEHPPAQALS